MILTDIAEPDALNINGDATKATILRAVWLMVCFYCKV